MPCAVMSWHRPNSWDAMDAEPRPPACRQAPPGTASQDESMSVSERQWPFVVSPGDGPWTGAEKPSATCGSARAACYSMPATGLLRQFPYRLEHARMAGKLGE